MHGYIDHLTVDFGQSAGLIQTAFDCPEFIDWAPDATDPLTRDHCPPILRSLAVANR